MTPEANKPIQESFGDSIIETIHRFAEADLDDVPTLQTKYLFHVGDPDFRQTLAETLYGARWIYKLGLALLVTDEKQMAHVRAQLIDYCSVCEGVLSDMVAHGMTKTATRQRQTRHETHEWQRGPRPAQALASVLTSEVR